MPCHMLCLHVYAMPGSLIFKSHKSSLALSPYNIIQSLNYPTQMRKGKSNQFCPSVSTKIARFGDQDVIVRCKYHYSTKKVGNLPSLAF